MGCDKSFNKKKKKKRNFQKENGGCANFARKSSGERRGPTRNDGTSREKDVSEGRFQFVKPERINFPRSVSLRFRRFALRNRTSFLSHRRKDNGAAGTTSSDKYFGKKHPPISLPSSPLALSLSLFCAPLFFGIMLLRFSRLHDLQFHETSVSLDSRMHLVTRKLCTYFVVYV